MVEKKRIHAALFAAAIATIAPAVPIAAGVVLLVGCLGVLLGNVASTGALNNGRARSRK